MRKKPTISLTIIIRINELMNDGKVNKSKLIESLIQDFFTKKKIVPKKFL